MTLIDQQRQLLELLDARLSTTDGRLTVTVGDLHAWGEQIGMAPKEVERMFQRLVDEKYIHAGRQGGGLGSTPREYYVEYIADKGLVALGSLPGGGIEGLVAVLQEMVEEIQNNPVLSPEEKDKKAKAVEGVKTATRVLATEMGPKALAEVFMRWLTGGAPLP